MEPIIRVRNLTKRYKKSTTAAVDGIDFDVEPGELFAFLGPNGAGKTTTISILTTTLALVGIHGSWNRTPPRAPEVSYFPWANGTLGPQRTLVGGFQDASGDRWGRPVAAVVGPDRSIYVTDDDAGAVYRLTPQAR